MTSVLTTPTLPRHAAPPAGPDRTDRPRWQRPALAVLLLGTAVLYLWNLSASGYGNSFYAAAVQSGTQSWKAWLFGSLDSGNVLTVDKPPAALWVDTAFARVFGFSSWTVLGPQALLGVGAVALLHAAVRRTSGPAAGLLAGAGLALTPVAALMFRFNNPDALLVFLLVLAAYCVVRALENASPRWLALAGVAVGSGFLTKMMQAFLALPAFALVYLVAAPTGPGRRLLHLLGAALAVVVSAGWYLALVDLWPAADRPYIGGSTDNSLLELALGYNGLGRIFGNSGGGPGGGGGGGNVGFGGSAGITRMFGASMGTEISWLLPAALIGLVAGLWFTRGAPRTDRTRAALLLWGGWLLVTAAVFSFMSGIIHPYYTVALAPAITAIVAISGRELWRGRENLSARLVLAAMVAGSAVWGFVLLDRTPDWLPALRWIVAVLGVLVATALIVGVHQFRRVATVLVTAVVLTAGIGGAAYAVGTAARAHTGSIPVSGPGSLWGGGPGGGMGGGPGGEGSANSELAALLADTTGTWAAATTGSQSAASLELASGKAVMGIGGWDGSDPAPSLERFQQYVADGQVRYFVAGNDRGGPGGGNGTGSEIAAWVAQNYAATTMGGQTVYDLSAG